MENDPLNPTLSPIIKWAGGKEKEVHHILANAPNYFEDYYEPFVGGGSVFVSFQARHFFINDKSDELISLYRSIADGDNDFFHYMSLIVSSWSAMLQYAAQHLEFVEIYQKYRTDIINDELMKSLMMSHIQENASALSLVLPDIFSWHRDVFFSELRTNLTRKTSRMKKIEKERCQMPDNDIYDNIETAFMSALYMYYRALYNDQQLRQSNPPLSTALFVFIRNYAYSGMFRYNDKGEFNVPYGGIGYNHKTLSKKASYYQSVDLLQHMDKATISTLDFEVFLHQHTPSANDFIFLDPPYDSEFSTYAQNAFTREDQQRLALYLCNECRAKWLMIIKNTPFIFNLYDRPELTIRAFSKKYQVSFMNRNDRKVEHLIITNY